MTELHLPGSEQYLRSSTPHNPSARQEPSAVVVARSAQDVADAVRVARERGWQVAPQATGHGAAGDIGPGTLLVDLSALSDVAIDPVARTARVGAGAVWSAINSAAAEHGLLGRGGTSSSVGAAGYTFGGGVGWLVRPHGLASGHLTAVDFVDSAGNQRRAADDADDESDRDALWAFRGGDGVGIATGLEFDLVPVSALWSGYLLWDAEQIDAVVTAWARALPDVGPALSSTISVLHAPPIPLFPPELQGRWVVHLALASTRGEEEAAALMTSLESAPPPAVTTWGPSDADRLAMIHLDPPPGTAALGGGRWLGPDAARLAPDILRAALDDGSELLMVEIRHVENSDPALPGAMTSTPGPFLLHAVGAAGEPAQRERLNASLHHLWTVAGPAETGRPPRPSARGSAQPGPH
ncbi:FAD-binding oxidoreductase [Pengzhenrongella sp.]|jgi:FAD/FMN-containing dehydrogenase|uniref:FAD-binding oxidoreductase n=1 Tax=Pengzhenrongella sp. TaxID=2888820 RepID=UPI002F92EC38